MGAGGVPGNMGPPAGMQAVTSVFRCMLLEKKLNSNTAMILASFHMYLNLFNCYNMDGKMHTIFHQIL